MLKKFLNFFKHEGEDQEALDPKLSYLDFLLEHIEAPVSAHLDRCHDHDPFLLAIVEALRVSMPETWSSQMRHPLTDEHTPVAVLLPPAPLAPPPPPVPLLPEEEETKEMVREDADGEELEAADQEPGELVPQEDSSPEAQEFEAEDAEKPEENAEDVEEDEALAPAEPKEDYDHDIESIDDSHIIDATDSEVTQVAHEERTQEFDGRVVDDGPAATGADGLPRIDRDEVLQAGRVYLGMLIENDRLPPKLQLSGEETLLARDLLVAYFLGKTESNKAQKLLRLVEQKFSEGKFSQARLLLQLFQAERQTRIRNDRNIFYEDMIQRLGTRRKNPLAADALATFKALEASPQTGWSPLFAWLHDKVAIDLHLFLHQPEKIEQWRAIAKKSTVPHATDYLLRYIPPKRWRPLHWRVTQETPILDDLIVEHMTPELLSRYVSNQLRTCYFVLRAVGDTGLEGFLDTFFEWTTKAFDLDMTLVLPELYRRTMGDVDTIDFIFKDIYARIVRTKAEKWFASLSTTQIQAACAKALVHITTCDLNEVLPGHYDFGSLVLDQLLEVEYPTKEFAFKIHRLV